METESEDECPSSPSILTKNGKLKRTNATCVIPANEQELEYRSKAVIPDIMVHSDIMKCTACFENVVNQLKKGEAVPTHPCLQVLMCKKCFKFYNTGAFSVDEEEEEKYCRWCGNGGKLFLCSKCICGFCHSCVAKNLGPQVYQQVKDDEDWACLLCEPKPLWHLRQVTQEALDYSKKQRKLRKERHRLRMEELRKKKLRKKKLMKDDCSDESTSTGRLSKRGSENGKQSDSDSYVQSTTPSCSDFSSDSSMLEPGKEKNPPRPRPRHVRKLLSDDEGGIIVELPRKKSKREIREENLESWRRSILGETNHVGITLTLSRPLRRVRSRDVLQLEYNSSADEQEIHVENNGEQEVNVENSGNVRNIRRVGLEIHTQNSADKTKTHMQNSVQNSEDEQEVNVEEISGDEQERHMPNHLKRVKVDQEDIETVVNMPIGNRLETPLKSEPLVQIDEDDMETVVRVPVALPTTTSKLEEFLNVAAVCADTMGSLIHERIKMMPAETVAEIRMKIAETCQQLRPLVSGLLDHVDGC